MDIKARVNTVIAEELGIDPGVLTADRHLRTLPGVDSMKVLRIIVRIEKTFDIELEDDVTFRIRTVGEFHDIVAGLHGSGAAA